MKMDFSKRYTQEQIKEFKQVKLFMVRDGGVNQIGTERSHWVATKKYDTKKAVMKAYNTPGYAKKVRYVWTAWEFLNEYGPVVLTKKLKECFSW